MKKQFIFLYRYVIKSRRWRKWINRQTVTILVVAAVLMSAIVWLTPPEHPRTRAAANPTPGIVLAAQEIGQVQATPTRTPFPPEFLTNADQTAGVALAGAILVLIVVLGWALLMPREDK